MSFAALLPLSIAQKLKQNRKTSHTMTEIPSCSTIDDIPIDREGHLKTESYGPGPGRRPLKLWTGRHYQDLPIYVDHSHCINDRYMIEAAFEDSHYKLRIFRLDQRIVGKTTGFTNRILRPRSKVYLIKGFVWGLIYEITDQSLEWDWFSDEFISCLKAILTNRHYAQCCRFVDVELLK